MKRGEQGVLSSASIADKFFDAISSVALDIQSPRVFGFFFLFAGVCCRRVVGVSTGCVTQGGLLSLRNGKKLKTGLKRGNGKLRTRDLIVFWGESKDVRQAETWFRFLRFRLNESIYRIWEAEDFFFPFFFLFLPPLLTFSARGKYLSLFSQQGIRTVRLYIPAPILRIVFEFFELAMMVSGQSKGIGGWGWVLGLGLWDVV